MRAYNLSKVGKLNFVLKASTAAETSTGQDSAVVDMQGFDSCVFIGTVASATGADAVQTMTVRGSTASGGTYQALSSATVTTTTGTQDGLLAIEVVRPTFRYLKARIARTTAASQHGGIIAIQSDARAYPTTHDSTSMLGGGLVRVLHAAT